MKRFMLISFLSCLVSVSRSQTLSPKVISTAGNEYKASTISWSWTMGETVIPTIQNSNNILTQGFQQPEVEIITGNISSTHCAGETFSLPFSAFGIIGTNNIFTAQLSDASGDFTNAVDIGSVTGNSGGNISVTIPQNTPVGIGYKIRVVSNLPSYKGKISSATLTISKLSVSVSGNTGICAGASANLNADGGDVYSWSPSTGLNNPGIKNPVASPLVSTTYTVSVSNNEGCSATASVTIAVTDNPNISSAIVNANVCGEQGSIITFISGGVAPYTFAWSNGGTTNALSGLTPGSYSLSVTGANCTSVRDYQIETESNTTNLTVTASDISNCGLKLSWNAHPQASVYRIKYKVKDSANWSPVIPAGNNLSYQFTGLNASTKYSFRVFAICANGNSITNKTINATTKSCMAPLNPAVTVLSTTKAIVQWTEVCKPLSYRVRYRKVGTLTWSTRGTSSTSVTLRNLEPAADYEYQVRATCPDGTSKFTPLGYFSTPAKRIEGKVVSESISLKLFPNPNTGSFTLMSSGLDDDKPTRIEIFNLFGQRIYSDIVFSNGGNLNYKITLDQIPIGIYELRAINNEVISVERFVTAF